MDGRDHPDRIGMISSRAGRHDRMTGTYYNRIIENSFDNRRIIKRDMVNILKKHGFKRSFWRHPFSEVYTLGSIKAEVYSQVEGDPGSKKWRIPPYTRGIAGVEIKFYETTPAFKRTRAELDAYRKEYEENLKGKKQLGRIGVGLEDRVGIFILFVLGGIALSTFSLTTTGNAISNLTQTTPGLLGLIFFIVGLVGLVFSRKR